VGRTAGTNSRSLRTTEFVLALRLMSNKWGVVPGVAGCAKSNRGTVEHDHVSFIVGTNPMRIDSS